MDFFVPYPFSASQMRCLLHILPILLGDVLNENEFFEGLLLLHDICAIIFSPLISEEQVPLLRLMIQQYLTNFKEQYQCNLPPKFHFLVHFPQQILRYNDCHTLLATKIIYRDIAGYSVGVST